MGEMMEPRFINFMPIPIKVTRKTPIWHVMTKKGSVFLGEIKWYTPWRKFAFFPNTSTIFEEECLRDIAAHCEYMTDIAKLLALYVKDKGGIEACIKSLEGPLHTAAKLYVKLSNLNNK